MDGVKLGLQENLPQFILLVIINAFVGAMIGIERSILPELAQQAFHVAAPIALLSFIVAFGVVKALANLFTGRLIQKIGRKKLLLLGWLLGIPVPFILMYAPTWSWVIGANLLLGAHQGFAWSTTVVMKIDLVGDQNRGFAMGLNEFAGYLAVALSAVLTAWLADRYGVRPYPFYPAVLIAVVGFMATWLLVKDTHAHVQQEAGTSPIPRLSQIFIDTSWRHPKLGAVTISGLVNNLNDGMIWGLLPVMLAGKGFSLHVIGLLAAVYPAVWGISQLFTGKAADRINHASLIKWGMLLQGLALVFLPFSHQVWVLGSMLSVLGIGTALVYPTFLAAIALHTHPLDRAKSLGIFRFWRDLGYAIGALVTGITVDIFGLEASMVVIGLLTGFIGWWAGRRMTQRKSARNQSCEPTKR